MLRFGLYTRKSHDDPKRTAKSIGEQLKECRDIQQQANLTVVDEWEESKSAKVPFCRPFYQEMIERIESGKINAILCWHVNRLVRNMDEGGHLVQLVIDGKLKEIRTPHSTYRTEDNILPIVIEAASATQYSLDLKHVVNRSLDGNFRSGGCNHKVPPGYRNGRDPLNTKRGIVLCDGSRFAMIRKFFDLIATDTYTVIEALDTLNNEWGFRVRPTEKLPARHLGKAAAYALVRNPFYAGFVRYRGEMARGRHKAMLTVDEYQRIQEVLDRRAVKDFKRRTHVFSGLFQCGYCDQQITAESKTIRNGSLWENYRCSDSWRRCTKQGMSESLAESSILDSLASVTINPDLATIATDDILECLDGSLLQVTAREAQEAEALSLSQERLNRIDELWISGALTDSKRYQELVEQEHAASRRIQIDVEQSRSEIYRMRLNAQRAREFVVSARLSFELGGEQLKREIARALVTKYAFYGREKKIVPEIKHLLKEMVKFCDEKSRLFEPSKSRSGKEESTAFSDAFFFGRSSEAGFEPREDSKSTEECQVDRGEIPENLREALSGELFPNITYLTEDGEGARVDASTPNDPPWIISFPNPPEKGLKPQRHSIKKSSGKNLLIKKHSKP